MYDITPDEFDRLDAIRSEAPVSWARWILNAVGVGLMVVALAVMLSFLLATTDGTSLPSWFYKALSPFGCCGIGVPGLLAFWSANKIYDGRKSGWYVGVLLGGVMVPSLCFPFGLVVLYGLLRGRTRALFRV